MEVDWRYRADYMHQRHGVSVEQANEALADLRALVFDPDYASKSGSSVRTIGWSDSAARLVTVLTVIDDGVTYGVNGWPANEHRHPALLPSRRQLPSWRQRGR